MLNKISEKYNKNDVGLYRNDGLALFINISDPELESMKKNFQSLFKTYELEIIIECNKNSSSLSWRLFQPQRWNLQVIPQTRQQDHLHKCTIKLSTKHKQLPQSKEQRLSNSSSDKTIFNEAAAYYEKALSEVGYNVKLKYNPNNKTKQTNKQKQKKEHSMSQSTIPQKCGNESWSVLFKIME